MGLGTSIVLIAVGAILRYAVTFDIVGVDIQVVGTILLIIGIIGLIISLIYMFVLNKRDGTAERTVVQDRYRDRY
jgi:beta-lactamase regulating signal transducer with metallopeptidase domain